MRRATANPSFRRIYDRK